MLFNNKTDIDEYREKSGIYIIKNIINNKVYVGSSTDIFRRWKEHFSYLSKGIHKNSHLQRSVRKYGIGSFKFEVVELVKNLSFLSAFEQKYLDYYRTLSFGVYNAGVFIERPNLGVTWSKDHPQRIVLSTRMKGNKIRLGMKNSDYHNKAISKANSGKIASDEARKNLSKSHEGIKNKTTLLKTRGIKRININDKNDFKIYETGGDVEREGFVKSVVLKRCDSSCFEGIWRSYRGYFWTYELKGDGIFDIDFYQKLTQRTAKKINENDSKYSKELNIAILAMGYCGEAGEATDYLKKVLGHRSSI